MSFVNYCLTRVYLTAILLLSQTGEAVDNILEFGDLQPVFGQITIGTIIAVISGLVSVCIGFVFLWWGVRKGISSIMAAFKKGKLKI